MELNENTSLSTSEASDEFEYETDNTSPDSKFNETRLDEKDKSSVNDLTKDKENNFEKVDEKNIENGMALKEESDFVDSLNEYHSSLEKQQSNKLNTPKMASSEIDKQEMHENNSGFNEEKSEENEGRSETALSENVIKNVNNSNDLSNDNNDSENDTDNEDDQNDENIDGNDKDDKNKDDDSDNDDNDYNNTNGCKIEDEKISNKAENDGNQLQISSKEIEKEKSEEQEEPLSVVIPVNEPKRTSTKSPRNKSINDKNAFNQVPSLSIPSSPQYSEDSDQLPHSQYENQTQKQTEQPEQTEQAEPKIEIHISNIDKIAHNLINEGDFDQVNDDNIDQILVSIRKAQRDALDEGDYEAASQAQRTAQEALRYVNEQRFISINSTKAQEINGQLQATKNDLAFLKEHWAHVLHNAKTQANAELGVLYEENLKELENFDKVNENSIPIQFKKRSPELLNLRWRQEAMVKSKRFLEAKEIKKEIERIERIELTQNFDKLQKKIECDRNKLIMKQNEKLDIRQQNWMRTIEGIRRVAKYEIEHATKSAKQLENKIEKSEMLISSTNSSLLRQQQQFQLQQQNESLSSKSEMQQEQVQMQHRKEQTARTAIRSVEPQQLFINNNRNNNINNNATAQEFRQRAMINRVTYSHIIVPRVKRAPRSSR